jgi:hypothetical protein
LDMCSTGVQLAAAYFVTIPDHKPTCWG